MDINGDLVVTGNCTEQNGACADYVFEEDYNLRALDDLSKYIATNKHLPNVPRAQEIQDNGVNLAHFSGRLLEKIEELTLYTLQQEETIQSLIEKNAQQQANYQQQLAAHQAANNQANNELMQMVAQMQRRISELEMR